MGQKKLINKGILTISTLVLTGVLSACGVNQKNPPLSTAEQDMQEASEEQCLGELNMDFVIDMFEAGTLKECDYFAYSNGVVDEEEHLKIKKS